MFVWFKDEQNAGENSTVRVDLDQEKQKQSA